MRRCEHACGCEGNAAGRDPETMRYLCAACMGRAILGTDCAVARKYFGHVPARFADPAWPDPPPLRDGDHTTLPDDFLTLRTDLEALPWDFLPLTAATNPTKPPKDPPSGPLPPPPPRPVQPNAPKPKRGGQGLFGG